MVNATELSYIDAQPFIKNTYSTTLVLIHGLGSRKESWRSQMKLSGYNRVIAVDLRGHGETVAENECTIKNFALDIATLLDDLNIKNNYICGLSLGGIVAQELQIQRPDLVKGLILISSTAYIPSFYTHGMLIETKKNFDDGSLIEKIVARGLVDSRYSYEAEQAFLIRDCYMDSAKSAIGLNYFGSLLSIDKPVLLIAGREDEVIPYWNVNMMSWFLPNSEKLILENAGHLCNIEKSNEVNNAIAVFVDKQESRKYRAS